MNKKINYSLVSNAQIKIILLSTLKILIFASFYTNLAFSSPTFEQLLNGEQIDREEFENTILDFIGTYPEKENDIAYPVFKKIIKADSQVAIHADLHGDKTAAFEFIKDLIKKKKIDEFDDFKITDPNFYIVFTGDFTDRGPDGLEVLYTIMRLRIENHNQVIIIKGNHESVEVNKKSRINFFEELKNKNIITGKEIEPESGEEIDLETEFEGLIYPLYNVLPVAAYLGIESKLFTSKTKIENGINSKIKNNSQETSFINYAMFTHAGIEPRFNPKNLLGNGDPECTEYITKLDINWIKDKEFIEAIKKETTNKIFKDGLKEKISDDDISDLENLGFIWSDFLLDENKAASISTRLKDPTKNSILIADYGKKIVEKYLDLCGEKDKYQVNTIIRGHQHSGELFNLMLKNNGIYGLWGVKQFDKKTGSYVEIPKNSVWTLLASPATFDNNEKPTFDTYAILYGSKEFKDWKLEPINLNLKK